MRPSQTMSDPIRPCLTPDPYRCSQTLPDLSYLLRLNDRQLRSPETVQGRCRGGAVLMEFVESILEGSGQTRNLEQSEISVVCHRGPIDTHLRR